MTYMGQMQAVTGRRIAPSYTADINARTPYLPSMYRMRDQDAHRDKEFQLVESQLDYQQKQDKRSNRLALAGIAIPAGIQYMQSGGDDTVKKAAKKATEMIGTGASSGTSGIIPSLKGKATDAWGGLKSAGSNWVPWAAGAAGGMIGSQWGEKISPIGKGRGAKMFTGAVAGGGLALASGGSLYDMAVGGLMGGAIGGLF